MHLASLLCWSLLLLLAPAISAADNSKRITWRELSSMATPEHVMRIVLPDRVRVEGRPLEFKPESLVFHVTRTSDKKLHPKGRMTVPRNSVTSVSVRSPRWKCRWIGALAGAAPGLAIIASNTNSNNEASVYLLAAGAGITAIGIPVGYFIGRAIDRRFHKFVITAQ